MIAEIPLIELDQPNHLLFMALATEAWKVRLNASLLRDNGTKVGAALATTEGYIVTGCNVEHPFLTATIHAETNAIGTMIARHGPAAKIHSIMVTAERHKFTPCGGCMDMIMAFGHEKCMVGYQNKPGGVIHTYTLSELMPEYPC